MSGNPISAKSLLRLVAAVLVLPIAISVLVAVAALLSAMEDAAGSAVLKYIALGCGILWTIGLVCLLVFQTLRALDDRAPDDKTDS